MTYTKQPKGAILDHKIIYALIVRSDSFGISPKLSIKIVNLSEKANKERLSTEWKERSIKVA